MYQEKKKGNPEKDEKQIVEMISEELEEIGHSREQR